MADIRRSGYLARGAWLWLCVLGFAAGGSGVRLAAQDAAVVQDAAAPRPPTLHVYTDLLQIPVLVLNQSRQRLATPIAPSQFSVSIDSGPWFRATHVRQEGDDAISLAILLDARGDGALLLPKIDEAIAGLAPEWLHTKDHVTIYSLDCSLVIAGEDMPANAAGLKRAAGVALQKWADHKEQKRAGECKGNVHLWDSMVYMTDALGKLPGRRVILAVTDGHDGGSKRTWNELTTFAQSKGVAIFGMMYTLQGNAALQGGQASGTRGRGAVMGTTIAGGPEDAFQSVTQLSGGTVLAAARWTIAKQLKQFTTMLRERYIVEFPRPANGTIGAHGLDVRVEKGDYFIRASGISFPIRDPSLLADPNTIQSDPSNAPTVGTRRVLSTSH